MESVVGTMWTACCETLPTRTPIRSTLDGLAQADPTTAVFELCKLIEVLWRVAGRSQFPDEKAPVSAILVSLKTGRVLPREVAKAGFEIIDIRNRLAHSPQKHAAAPVAWQDLLGALAECHKVLEWLSTQEQLLHEFCEAVSVDKGSSTVLASTPSDDWLNYRIRTLQRHEVQDIIRVDRSVYEAIDIVPEEVVLGWWDADPECLTCIEWAGERLSGYFCMLFPKPQVLDLIIAGRLHEKEIKGKDLYRCARLTSPKDAYVSSIVVQNRFSALTPLLIQHMANRFQWLHKAGILRRVFAIAASDNGERLVKRFNFALVTDEEHTADHHPLYVLDMSSVGESFQR